ncbi:MAG: hypothetical protein EP344_07555 [Bacteroidetes bacterium]|nr:MAG: hypothetical protein EP344_07555 [Bacteroidota bacterium]
MYTFRQFSFRLIAPLLLMVICTLCSATTGFTQGTSPEADTLKPAPFAGTLEFDYVRIVLDTSVRRYMEQSFVAVAEAANSEENQKALQQMEANLRDPNMKAYYEANPEIKARIQDQVRTMRRLQQGAETAMGAANTSTLTLKVRDSSMTALATGSFLSPQMQYRYSLYEGVKKKVYLLDHSEKQYQEIRPEVDSSKLAGTITPLEGDSVFFEAFPCKKYAFEADTGSQQITGVMWVASDLKPLAQVWKEYPDLVFLSQVDGFPVSMTVQPESTKDMFSFIFTLKKVKKEQLAVADFKVPANFTKKDSPRKKKED